MSLTVQEALQRAIEHREIFPDEMLSIMRRIMSGCRCAICSRRRRPERSALTRSTRR